MKLFKLLNYLMLGLFVFSLIVQYNDPDALRWMTIYGLAAVACIVALKRPAHWLLPGALGLLALGWAGTLALRVWGQVGLGELFEAWEMKDERVEEAREMGGLLIVAAWMLVLCWRASQLRLTRRAQTKQN
jgi:hypothetical protein